MPLKSSSPAVMSPLWLGLWAAFFSLCWLVPVHLLPWSTFPADAWVAFMALVGAAVLMARTRLALNWHGLPCLAAGLLVLPWLQFVFGLLPFAGQAWVSSAYLLGFLLALLVGAHWERVSASQLAHALFMAIGIAAVASVGLQLCNWLGLNAEGAMGMWVLEGTGSRPSANLGQPNQLATLLVWGLMACLWAYLHKAVGGLTALVVAAFLLLGIALTQSRAGLLGLTVILAAVWFWRALWPSRLLPRTAAALYLYVLALPPLLQWLNAALLLGQQEVHLRLGQDAELRLDAWRMFVQAVRERPWFGYGWTDVNSAQMAVVDQFPGLDGIVGKSHNLFLDLVLWNGLPIGLLVAAGLVLWFWKKFCAVRQAQEAALFLLLLAVAIHALVEFPLQYAYFLLPAGLVMGMLNVRLGARLVGTTPRWSLPALWLAGALAFGVTVRDYAQVDASYTLLRLEQSIIGQGRPPMGGPPDVWVLTQLREWIVVARYKPRPGMREDELAQMRVIAHFYPSFGSLYRLAAALALNGQPDEARVWLGRICKITHQKQCLSGQREWAEDPRLAAVQWPR